MFIADSASHSAQAYHESTGDVDVSVTPWKMDKDGVYVRTIEYKHPVDIPLAPPFARARKEQRYRRFGQYGLSLETDTYVQDVPLASNFYVADRVLVEPSGSDERNVIVRAKFDVRFLKKVMFQSLTASHTGKKFVDGFQNQKFYWENALQSLVKKSCTLQPASVAPSFDSMKPMSQQIIETRVVATIMFTSTQNLILLLGLASFLLVNVCAP